MRVLSRSKPVYSLAFLRSGPEIACASGASACIWNYASARPKDVRAACVQPEGQVRFIAQAPAQGHLITANRDGTIRRWDEAGTSEASPPAFAPFQPTAAAISPDGRRLAFAGGNVAKRDSNESGRALAMQIAAEGGAIEEIGHFNLHFGAVRSIAFDPSGERLILGTTRVHALPWTPNARGELDIFDARARCWNGRRPQQQPPLDRPGAAVAEAAAISPDGALLATAGDARILLWDLRASRWFQTLVGLERDNVLAFAPAGDALLSAGHDGLLRIWDLPAGRERARFDCGLKKLHALALSPDGTLAAVGGDRGVALVELDERMLG